MKIIAICSNIPVFWENRCLDKGICAKYPGAMWMPIFFELIKDDFLVLSGDVAIKKINKKEIKPKDVLIIQEMNAKHGVLLKKIGAFPFLITMGESPRYSYVFYDFVKKYADNFLHKMLFGGVYKGNSLQMRFPSFHEKLLSEQIVIWSEREYMVLVANNKNPENSFPKFQKFNFLFLKQLIHWLYKKISPAYNKGYKNSLHEYRFKMIEYFSNKNKFALYGMFWDDGDRYEKKWKTKMLQVIENLNPKKCENKYEIIKNYKFTVCIENTAFDGYITEKIIDALAAGSIPLYLGAPEIEKHIPKNCFIDLRDFETFEKLEEYLESIDEEKAISMIKSGREFLKSETGKLHSYEGFAQNIKSLVMDYCKNA